MASLPHLKSIRVRRALSQRGLSEASGVSRMTIARLEAGGEAPFPSTVRKLAQALNVDPTELMGMEQPGKAAA